MNKYMKLENIGYSTIGKNEKSLLNEIKHIRDFFENMDRKIDNIYINRFPLFPGSIELVYFDDICLYNIPVHRINYDTVEEYKNKFIEYEKVFYRAYEDGKYDDVSKYFDQKFQPLVFNIFYSKMQNEDKFKNFIEMYKTCNYVLNKLPLKTIREIYKFAPKELLEKRKYSSLADCDGYINIYRGVGSKSSKGSKAISWTTDKEIAKWFANRFNRVGKVISGKIHIDDVVFIFREEMQYFINDEENSYEEKEKEVIVRPEKVIVIEENKVYRN